MELPAQLVWKFLGCLAIILYIIPVEKRNGKTIYLIVMKNEQQQQNSSKACFKKEW